ncbi:hypothetical protein T492DRAFT_1131176 [Pavlovales sp. CCMP2436]|nr:hypothetical protein T492DRAFT_1131176 [Pavlovales sp. CCMP2436]
MTVLVIAHRLSTFDNAAPPSGNSSGKLIEAETARALSSRTLVVANQATPLVVDRRERAQAADVETADDERGDVCGTDEVEEGVGLELEREREERGGLGRGQRRLLHGGRREGEEGGGLGVLD